MHAAPLAIGPSSLDNDTFLQFTFSEPMADDIDLTWTGVDGSKVSCNWFTPPFVTFKVILNCSHEGGWPAGTEVGWTVNAGNSGTMKGELTGEAVAETSGTVTIPGGGGGNPDPDPDPDPGNDTVGVTPAPFDGESLFPGQSVRFTFDVAMKEQMDIVWDQGDWNCTWFTIPELNLPRTTLDCEPPANLASGTYTWTINGSGGPGFESLDGGPVETISGTVIIGDGGGGPGIGEPVLAPDCGEPHDSLPFPKRMSLCGTDIYAWSAAIALPAFGGGGYGVIGGSSFGEGSHPSLIAMDDNGMTLWKVYASESGIDLARGQSANIVQAYGPRDGQFVFGAFDANDAFTPLYQQQVPIAGDDYRVSPLGDGRIAVLQAMDSSVQVFVIGTDGQVDWAKTLTSERFAGLSGLGIGQITGLTRTLSLGGSPDGLLVSVVQTETTQEGQDFSSTSTVTIVRLNNAGAMDWVKSYGDFENTNPTVIPTETGVYISVLDITPPINSTFFKLNNQGNVAWGRQIDDATVSFGGELPNGKVILTGGQLQGLEALKGTLILLNANGSVDKSVELDSGEGSTALPAIFPGTNRVFIALVSVSSQGPVGAPPKPIFGAADFQLSTFTWKTYAESATFATLIPNFDGAGALLGSFDSETHALDTFKVTDDLAIEGGCFELDDSDLMVSPAEISTSNATTQALSHGVTMENLTITLADTTIALQSVECDELDLCADGGGNNGGGDPGTQTDAGLTIRKTGRTTADLEFDSELGKTYTIERSLDLTIGSWMEFEVIPGHGGLIQSNVSNNPRAAYFRLREE